MTIPEAAHNILDGLLARQIIQVGPWISGPGPALHAITPTEALHHWAKAVFYPILEQLVMEFEPHLGMIQAELKKQPDA